MKIIITNLASLLSRHDSQQTASENSGAIQNQTTSEEEKSSTYGNYNIPHPTHNTGKSETCELDHLVSLELGGADTLNNLWPQCGPDGVQLDQRYFKEKDLVENYLAKQVKEGKMALENAQKGIATDWTQYLDAARAVSQ